MDVLAAAAAMIAEQRETTTTVHPVILSRAIDDDSDVEVLDNDPTNIDDAPTTNVTAEEHQIMHDSMMIGTSSLSMQSTVLIDGGDPPDNMLVISSGRMSNAPSNPPEEIDGEDISMSSQTSSIMTCGNRTNLETSKLVDFLDEPMANIMSMIQSMERMDGQWQFGRNNGTATHRNLANIDGGGERNLLPDPVVAAVAAAAIDASSSLDRHPACDSGASGRLDETSTEEGKEQPSPSSSPPEAIIDGPTSPEEETDGPPSRGRKIGRMRRYRERDAAYGDWLDIHLPSSCGSSEDCDGPSSRRIDIVLRRGGKLGLRPNMLSTERRTALSASMRSCVHYRQYTRSGVYHEPRFHVLLSSEASVRHDAGYSYHGIKMKALPIELVPEVASYAREVAGLYGLPGDRWGIGVDLIAYRDGEDSIGWHADDTQGESVVLCVVVDAPGEARPVNVRPNVRTGPLSDGDEEIELYLGEGDGYDMDGVMQNGYEHRLPKRIHSKAHRFVLIFRQGNAASVPIDSGVALAELVGRGDPLSEDVDLASLFSRLRVKRPSVSFGHPQGVMEGSWYSRRFLYSSYGHRADQRGVNGNINFGADSIVVSRQSLDHREEDGLQWLRYTSNRSQGGGALSLVYSRKLPVRVWRSSRLKTEYAPPELEGGQTSYRYDGLYVVTSIWDGTGRLTAEDSAKFPAGGIQYTFHLERLIERLPPPVISNSLSLLELWGKIQLSHGRTPVLPFVPNRPKDLDNLPELLNDAQQQPKKYHENESRSSVCYSNANGVASQPMFNNSLKQLEKRSSFSSQRAASESPLEGWRRLLDARLTSAPNPSSQYCIPWASVPAVLVGYGRSLSYLPSHHIMPPPPLVFVSPPQGSSIAPGEQQETHRPNNEREYYTSSIMHDVRRRPCHGAGIGFVTDGHGPFPSIRPPVPLRGRFSDVITAARAPQRNLMMHCDLNDPTSILNCLPYPEGSSRLRTLLAETAKSQTIGENMQYVRKFRNPTEKLQHQYKQYKTSKKREEKETLDVVEWEQFEQKWEEVLHEYCDSPMLLSSRLQPLEIFQRWFAARKKKWRQQQQKKMDRHESQERQDSEQCKRRWELVDRVQDSQMLLSRRVQPEKLFRVWLAESKKEWRQQRENKWNENGLPEAAERNSLAFTGRAILALNAFVSESIQLIFCSTTRPRKKSDLLLPARKIGSGAKQQVTRGLMVKNPRPLREDKRARSPLQAFATSLKIMPRFIIDEGTRTQSVCPHLEASYSVGRRKVLQVKVTVKWIIPDQRPKQSLCGFGGGQAYATKRNVELMSGETAKASRPHKSLKTHDKIDTVELSQSIIPRFITDEEQRTESVSPQLEASLSKGRRKLLKMSVTVKWGFPNKCQATQIYSVGDDQSLCRERKGLSVKVVPEATNASMRQKSPRLSHVLFARIADAVELVPEETVKASRSRLKLLDEMVTAEKSRYIVHRFVTDEEKRTESTSPHLEAFGGVVEDQALCRDKHKRVEVVSEVINSLASRRQKSPRLSHDVPGRNVDAVELVSEGTAKASRPHKSLNIPEEIVDNEQPRYIVPRFVIDEEKGTESTYPNLEASFSKGRRKLLNMSVKVKWGIPGKRDMGRAVDDQARCRERNGLPVEVLSEATSSDASSRRKSPRLSHFRVNEVVFAWDKGHLYEAKVSTWRDVNDGGMEYFVHYLGYGKTHDRWLATKDIMKCTPATREFYNKCTSWPLKSSDAWT